MVPMPTKPAPASRSTAVEDYLEQILALINTKGYARVADIAQGGAVGIAAMGKIMAAIRPQLAGRADMSLVSAKVKSRLNS